MKAALWLVHNGVSLDVALSLDESELFGWSVALGEMTSGRDFNWDSMSWPE
jgi:hypothetical protein